MSAPPPKRSLMDELHEPGHDVTAKPSEASARSVETLADLPDEPGQSALGPTADNDLDLLGRHLDDGRGWLYR
jgi:hypothetical protein